MKKLLLIGGMMMILLTGCMTAKNNLDNDAVDGDLKYNNADLGFSLSLPADFVYFQTQRIDKSNYSDIEIFVPTSDKQYAQEVEGYGKPIVVRVMDKDEWEKNSQSPDHTGFEWVGNSLTKSYIVKFWDKTPADWSARWTEDMKKSIIGKFDY